ncbi:hypothetical protein FO441_03775 [Salinicoccus cyprini]|uniref:Uncharacterized protein n=1 Tax=Salinicoccus cyprini TaxID=2493691 RepID=A0A558AYS7_9STAP|nr:hypothetical protein [Salinicoccus cyprini]TVT29412.1 hypothetical protein FO441_03775 [Salinicoccus cyprini]
MAVKILRRTGWMGSLLSLNIKIDDEKITALRFDEKKEIDIPNDDMEIRVAQFGSSSNRITVDDGDTVMIRTPIVSHVLMYSFFLFLILSFIFSITLFSNPWIFITVAVILLMLEFITDQYRLEVIDKAEWKQNSAS